MPFDPSAVRSGTVFSDNPSYAMAWVCYVNGLEVPILGFDLNYGVWQIPTFQIHLVPDVTLQRLGAEDRVQVALFYLDYHVNPDKPEFRLLCDGEIVGWSYQNVSGSRSMSFQCIAHIHLFQQLYFFYMTNVDDVIGAQSPDVKAQGFSTPGLLYPYALFHQGLIITPNQLNRVIPPTTSQNGTPTATVAPAGDNTVDDATRQSSAPIQAPYELVYNVIKGIISSQVDNKLRAIPMMNFFSRHTRKTRFHNRWVRLPIFEDPDVLANGKGVFPIFKAAQNEQALEAMQTQLATEVSHSGPVWDMLRTLLSVVYMEIAMVPNPACVRVTLEPSPEGFPPQDGKILGLLEPTTPLISVSQTGQPSTLERAKALANRIRTYLESGTSIDPSLLEEAGINVTAPSLSDVNLSEIVRHLTVTAPGGGDGPSAESADPALLTTNPMQPVRLAQYFVKPQFLFGIAPMFNVFFPSMHDGQQYDENYINQPTRTYINDSVMTAMLRAQGPNKEFMLHALSVGWPEEANALLHQHVAGTAEDGHAASVGATHSGRNLLIWPEEFYKGPVTARMELPKWFQMLRQFANANTGGPTEEGATNLPAAFGQTSNVNADITATAPPTVVPDSLLRQGSISGAGATFPSATRPLSTRGQAVEAPSVESTGGALVGNPTRGSSTNTQGSPTVAVPITVNRTTRIVLNGGSAAAAAAYARFQLQVGGGLDPNRYLDLAKTSLWPQPPAPGRGQTRDTVRFRERTVPQKLAQLHRLFKRNIPGQFPTLGLSDTQLNAFTLGFVWIALTEGAVRDQASKEGCYCWGFGNVKQYNTYAPRNWTVQPDKQPYRSAPTADGGAIGLIEAVKDPSLPYVPALRALLGDLRSLPRDLQTFLRENAFAANDFWRRYAPIRPDWLYIALGYIGYYSTESDVHDGHDKVRRANLGLSRVSTMQRYFERILRVMEDGIPDDVVTVTPIPHRPLLSSDDLAYLQRGPRATASTRTVTRQIPRFTLGSMALAESSDHGGDAVRTTGPNGQVTTTGGGAAPSPNPAPGSANTHNAVAAPSPQESASAQRGDAFSTLFKYYAQYEHVRQRYYQRQLGVNMRFNPYVVPGFPGVYLDSMRTRFHSVGYVQTVSHSGRVSNGSGSMSTSVSMVCSRTFPEFLNDIRNDAYQFEARILAAPAEIIPEIRAIIQDEENSARFYFRLFYGNDPTRSLPVTFKIDQVFGYARGLSTENIRIEGDGVATVTARDEAALSAERLQGTNENIQLDAATPEASVQAGGLSSEGQTTFRESIDPNEELSPRDNLYSDAFDSHNVAMQIVARPVCTLTQYIRFWYGGRPLGDLLNNRLVYGPENTYSYAKVIETDVNGVGQGPDGTARPLVGPAERYPAIYYQRIYKLRPGPGPLDPESHDNLSPPTVEERGYTSAGHNGPYRPTATTSGVAADYPESRADWDVALEAYRERVRTRKSPST